MPGGVATQLEGSVQLPRADSTHQGSDRQTPAVKKKRSIKSRVAKALRKAFRLPKSPSKNAALASSAPSTPLSTSQSLGRLTPKRDDRELPSTPSPSSSVSTLPVAAVTPSPDRPTPASTPDLHAFADKAARGNLALEQTSSSASATLDQSPFYGSAGAARSDSFRGRTDALSAYRSGAYGELTAGSSDDGPESAAKALKRRSTSESPRANRSDSPRRALFGSPGTAPRPASASRTQTVFCWPGGPQAAPPPCPSQPLPRDGVTNSDSPPSRQIAECLPSQASVERAYTRPPPPPSAEDGVGIAETRPIGGVPAESAAELAPRVPCSESDQLLDDSLLPLTDTALSHLPTSPAASAAEPANAPYSWSASTQAMQGSTTSSLTDDATCVGSRTPHLSELSPSQRLASDENEALRLDEVCDAADCSTHKAPKQVAFAGVASVHSPPRVSETSSEISQLSALDLVNGPLARPPELRPPQQPTLAFRPPPAYDQSTGKVAPASWAPQASALELTQAELHAVECGVPGASAAGECDLRAQVPRHDAPLSRLDAPPFLHGALDLATPIAPPTADTANSAPEAASTRDHPNESAASTSLTHAPALEPPPLPPLGPAPPDVIGSGAAASVASGEPQAAGVSTAAARAAADGTSAQRSHFPPGGSASGRASDVSVRLPLPVDRPGAEGEGEQGGGTHRSDISLPDAVDEDGAMESVRDEVLSAEGAIPDMTPTAARPASSDVIARCAANGLSAESSGCGEVNAHPGAFGPAPPVTKRFEESRGAAASDPSGSGASDEMDGAWGRPADEAIVGEIQSAEQQGDAQHPRVYINKGSSERESVVQEQRSDAQSHVAPIPGVRGWREQQRAEAEQSRTERARAELQRLADDLVVERARAAQERMREEQARAEPELVAWGRVAERQLPAEDQAPAKQQRIAEEGPRNGQAAGSEQQRLVDECAERERLAYERARAELRRVAEELAQADLARAGQQRFAQQPERAELVATPVRRLHVDVAAEGGRAESELGLTAERRVESGQLRSASVERAAAVPVTAVSALSALSPPPEAAEQQATGDAAHTASAAPPTPPEDPSAATSRSSERKFERTGGAGAGQEGAAAVGGVVGGATVALLPTAPAHEEGRGEIGRAGDGVEDGALMRTAGVPDQGIDAARSLHPPAPGPGELKGRSGSTDSVENAAGDLAAAAVFQDGIDAADDVDSTPVCLPAPRTGESTGRNEVAARLDEAPAHGEPRVGSGEDASIESTPAARQNSLEGALAAAGRSKALATAEPGDSDASAAPATLSGPNPLPEGRSAAAPDLFTPVDGGMREEGDEVGAAAPEAAVPAAPHAAAGQANAGPAEHTVFAHQLENSVAAQNAAEPSLAVEDVAAIPEVSALVAAAVAAAAAAAECGAAPAGAVPSGGGHAPPDVPAPQPDAEPGDADCDLPYAPSMNPVYGDDDIPCSSGDLNNPVFDRPSATHVASDCGDAASAAPASAEPQPASGLPSVSFLGDGYGTDAATAPDADGCSASVVRPTRVAPLEREACVERESRTAAALSGTAALAPEAAPTLPERADAAFGSACAATSPQGCGIDNDVVVAAESQPALPGSVGRGVSSGAANLSPDCSERPLSMFDGPAAANVAAAAPPSHCEAQSPRGLFGAHTSADAVIDGAPLHAAAADAVDVAAADSLGAPPSGSAQLSPAEQRQIAGDDVLPERFAAVSAPSGQLTRSDEAGGASPNTSSESAVVEGSRREGAGVGEKGGAERASDAGVLVVLLRGSGAVYGLAIGLVLVWWAVACELLQAVQRWRSGGRLLG